MPQTFKITRKQNSARFSSHAGGECRAQIPRASSGAHARTKYQAETEWRREEGSHYGTVGESG